MYNLVKDRSHNDPACLDLNRLELLRLGVSLFLSETKIVFFSITVNHRTSVKILKNCFHCQIEVSSLQRDFEIRRAISFFLNVSLNFNVNPVGDFSKVIHTCEIDDVRFGDTFREICFSAAIRVLAVLII